MVEADGVMGPPRSVTKTWASVGFSRRSLRKARISSPRIGWTDGAGSSSTPSATPSSRPIGSRTSGEISLDGARPQHRGPHWHGSAHLKRDWMCVRQTRPPGRGDFWTLKIAYAPSPKNLSKNGFCPQKGGSLSVEVVFAKKNSGAGEDSAVGSYVRLQSRACGRGV